MNLVLIDSELAELDNFFGSAGDYVRVISDSH